MYIQLSTLYGEQQSTDEEICARKAFDAYEKAGLEAHVTNAMVHIAASILHQGDYLRCYDYADSILTRAITLRDTADIINAYVKKAQCAVGLDRLDIGESFFQALSHDYGYVFQSQDFSRLAVISANKEDRSRVESYFSHARRTARTFNDTLQYYVLASKAYRLLHADSLAYAYKDSSIAYENRFMALCLRHSALAAQKDYAELELENARLSHRQKILYLVLVILGLVMLLIWIVDYLRRQKLEARLQAEKIKNLLSELDKQRSLLNAGLMNLRHSEVVVRFQNSLASETCIHETDWKDLEKSFRSYLPTFEHSLLSLHELSQLEWRVCMLIKLSFSSSDIARLVNRSPTTIPSIRSRLYEKFFMKKGKASDWDDFLETI